MVTLAFQGLAWHVGNVPAKVLAFGDAQKREVLLSRVGVGIGICRNYPLLGTRLSPVQWDLGVGTEWEACWPLGFQMRVAPLRAVLPES